MHIHVRICAKMTGIHGQGGWCCREVPAQCKELCMTVSAQVILREAAYSGGAKESLFWTTSEATGSDKATVQGHMWM